MTLSARRSGASIASFGVVFPSTAHPSSLPGFLAAAEEAGLAEVWVVEDCCRSAGFSLAATALARSDFLSVGIGLAPAAVRNPVIAAMEAAPLLRIQLDSLTRISYLATAARADEVAEYVIGGGEFRKLKDAEGKPLSDARLIRHAERIHPWIKGV